MLIFYTTAITSTSTKAPLGRADTATQLRAGLPVKYLAYTSLNSTKSLISARKQVVFTTSSKVAPEAESTAEILCITCSVCVLISFPTRFPLAGSSAIYPEQKSKFSDFTACEYGPTAAGALFVEITSFMEKPFFNLISDTLHWISPAESA